MIEDVTWSCECGNVIKVPAAKAGSEYQCPNCHQTGWVPHPKVAPLRPKTRMLELPPIPQQEASMWTDPQVRRTRLKRLCESLYGLASTLRAAVAIVSFIIAAAALLVHAEIGMPAATLCLLWSVGAFFLAFVVAAIMEALAGILLMLLDIFAGLKLMHDESLARPPSEGT